MKNTWQRETRRTYVFTTTIKNKNFSVRAGEDLYYGWIKDSESKDLVLFEDGILDGLIQKKH